MTRKTYVSRITDACKKTGTYQPAFDQVISTLAQILETRDKAQADYEATGTNPVIARKLGSGEIQMVKNPYLQTIMDLNNQALAYWRDLGLTPKGLKTINDQTIKEAANKGKPTLASFLADIG